MTDPAPAPEADAVPLDRDRFLRSLLRHLSGTLQDVVGLEEAAGLISVVGQEVGEEIGSMYRAHAGTDRLDRGQVEHALVDLKRRIGGDFYVIERSEDAVVLGNRRCPFGAAVVGRPSLCMMTSNVFGSIAAHDLGYAKVELQETIAGGDRECRVVVHLSETPAARAAEGREYYRGPDAR